MNEPDPGSLEALQAIDAMEKKLLAAIKRNGDVIGEAVKAAITSPEQDQARQQAEDLCRRLADFDGIAKILMQLRQDAARAKKPAVGGRGAVMGAWFAAGGLIGAGLLYLAATTIPLPGMQTTNAADPSGGWAKKIWADNARTLPGCVTQAAQTRKPVQCAVNVHP